MDPSLLDAPGGEQSGTWSLPPRPPETWIGHRWSYAVVAVCVVAALLCLRPLALDHTRDALALAVAGSLACVAAVGAAFALLVQHTVRPDPALPWMAGGFAAVLTFVLARTMLLASATQQDAALARAAPLTLLTLALLPSVALCAGAARRGLALVLVPLVAAATLFMLFLDRPSTLTPLTHDDGEPKPLLRALFVAVAVAGLLAGARWRSDGSRSVRTPSTWLAAGLLLTAVVSLLEALAGPPLSGSFWFARWSETAMLLLTGGGLWLVCGAGYRRQTRRWRQLVTQVGMLRAASPLIPGLSITPEDDEGLPQAQEVRALIDGGLVRVALQPVVRLSDGLVVGFEALSRFGGRVPTDRWFRGASYCGLGGELERVTLQAALALLDRLPPEVFLAVNVSPAAVLDAPVQELLHGVDLSRIVVEVTEHEAVADYGQARRVLDVLRAAGARIAVDDTGAGFASLRHVLMLQPDIIKLDTSLTRDVQGNQRQQDLVSALASFAAEVGSVLLAEGIETEEQLDTLRDLRVPLGQGWHLGVPTVVQG